MKIALIGYGKMGKTIERIALSRGHEIVCTIDIDNPQDFDSDAFRSADVAINGAVASSKSSVVLRWSRIAVSAAAVLILGLLCFSKLNSESEYEAYKNSMSLSEVLNSMSDEELMYVSYYEIEDIPEYE